MIVPPDWKKMGSLMPPKNNRAKQDGHADARQEVYTLEEIGNMLGLRKQSVQYIERTALAKAKKFFTSIGVTCEND